MQAALHDRAATSRATVAWCFVVTLPSFASAGVPTERATDTASRTRIFFIVAIPADCSGPISLLCQEVARKRERRNYCRTHIAWYEWYEQAWAAVFYD
jgi:hypothetical protein